MTVAGLREDAAVKCIAAREAIGRLYDHKCEGPPSVREAHSDMVMFGEVYKELTRVTFDMERLVRRSGVVV